MAEMENSEPVTEEEILRQRLIKRIGVAGVSIIALVGGLAVFDALYVPTSSSAKLAKSPAPPIPAPPKPVVPEAAPVVIEEKASDNANVKTVDDKTPAKPVAEAERTTSPDAPPLRNERPLTKPATAQTASVKPTSVSQAPQTAQQQAAQQVEQTRQANSGSPSKPLANEANRRYLVQMGVFSNVTNAEELRARLEMAGIPSQIEARVQVGPFKSRAEAEAAQKKLASMGLDGGMLVSSKK